MSYPADENGRYFAPARPGEVRIEAGCHGCNFGWNVPERAREWFSFTHRREHSKGHNGLSAVAPLEVRRFDPDAEREAEP